MRIKPRHLLRLYPRQWRARYGDEFLALLEREGTTSRVVLNVLAGAFDAWMSPRSFGVPTSAAAPAAPVGPQVLLLQPNKGPRSASEIWSQFCFGAAALVSLLGLSVLLHAASNDSWLA